MNDRRNLSLQAGERIFINGAVIKLDRRVFIEFLNDAMFLAERNVLKPADTTTPLRQLYFVLQTIVMDRAGGEDARRLFEVQHVSLLLAFTNEEVLKGLMDVKSLVARGRLVEALDRIRGLFPIEDEILGTQPKVETRLLEAV